MAVSGRAAWTPVPGAEEAFEQGAVELVIELHDRFAGAVQAVRTQRLESLNRAILRGVFPRPRPPSTATTTAWHVPPLPVSLLKPGIEISGPAADGKMLINALNPGPSGERAEGDLDDDEDAGPHTLAGTVAASQNRRDALRGTLVAGGKTLAPGGLPFFMHRERGLHLDEPDFTVDGVPICATLLGTALTLFHAGAEHVRRGEVTCFYLPKTESPAETQLYRAIFDAAVELLPHYRAASMLRPPEAGPLIRAIVLVESLPAVYAMEEMLYALGPYAAGLNAARWDLKASILEYSLNDQTAIWPDRFGVSVKNTPFLETIFRRIVAVCAKHGAVAIGGMAVALPSRDSVINAAAAAAITEDKTWEAELGFLRGWCAHIYHSTTAAEPFKLVRRGGAAVVTAEMAEPNNFPVELSVPGGLVTEEGTRRNCRVLLEYLEGWLDGHGAKAIESSITDPAPACMEDLATARISVAQTAQRVLHLVRCEDTGQEHTVGLVRALLAQEHASILSRLGLAKRAAVSERYRQAEACALEWVLRYIAFDFRSLGSIPRSALYREARL